MSAAHAPLAGRRIVLTRSVEDCAAWADELRLLGAVPLVLPCITTEALDTPALRTALADGLASADWLVVTSRRGAEHTAALLDGAPLLPARVRIAAVGDATAAAARVAFGRVDLIGAGTAAALAAALIEERGVGTGSRVLLAVAENARDELERVLGAAGAACTRLAVYRTTPSPPREPKRKLSALGADAIVLASPTAVTGFLHQVEMDAPAAIYTIGLTTAEAVRAQGLNVTAAARTPSLAALLEAIQCGT